jgi:hypothetical protein
MFRYRFGLRHICFHTAPANGIYSRLIIATPNHLSINKYRVHGRLRTIRRSTTGELAEMYMLRSCRIMGIRRQGRSKKMLEAPEGHGAGCGVSTMRNYPFIDAVVPFPGAFEKMHFVAMHYNAIFPPSSVFDLLSH